MGRLPLHGSRTRENGGDVQMTNENIEVPLDIHYDLEITGKVKPEHTLTHSVSEWLQANLTGLKDSNNKTIFSKVNYGFQESNLKSFGSKPTCDVYVGNVEYDLSFDQSVPKVVRSIVLFYFKGANNNAYLEACKLHDYIMSEFMGNTDWKELPMFVSDTQIIGSRVMNQQIRKQWGVMGVFELLHKIY